MPRQVRELLPGRHGGPSLHPGEDDGLTLAGHGVLGIENGRGGEGGGHAGDDIVLDAELVQPVHLLPVGAVDGGIAGVHACDGLPFGLGLLHDRDDLVQIHQGAVVDGRTLLVTLQDGGVDQ